MGGYNNVGLCKGACLHALISANACVFLVITGGPLTPSKKQTHKFPTDANAWKQENCVCIISGASSGVVWEGVWVSGAVGYPNRGRYSPLHYSLSMWDWPLAASVAMCNYLAICRRPDIEDECPIWMAHCAAFLQGKWEKKDGEMGENEMASSASVQR